MWQINKQILILGGTNFIGRNLIEKLKDFPQYDLTLFNRQQTAPSLFQEIKSIKGDRSTNDISQLANQYWDCIIDLSCYYPKHLTNLLNILEGKFKRYIFISTISAYSLTNEIVNNAITENVPTLSCSDQEKEDSTSQTYGNRKAECERILLNNKQLDKIILRPSVVYGKYDPTDRFYYWLYKAKLQQPILIPGNPTHKITLTYVHDLIHIILQSIEKEEHATVYNTSTHEPLTLTSLVHAIDKDLATINIPDDQLIKQGIFPEESIPLWFNMPLMINNERLRGDYKALTPFEKSIQETNKYYADLGWPIPKTA